MVSATKTGEVTKQKKLLLQKHNKLTQRRNNKQRKRTPAVETKAENAVTPKRKVGRPRKNSDTTDKKEVEETKQVASNSVEAKPVVAEKRPKQRKKQLRHSNHLPRRKKSLANPLWKKINPLQKKL